MCPKLSFQHLYKVSAWNSHHNFDFWHSVCCLFHRSHRFLLIRQEKVLFYSTLFWWNIPCRTDGTKLLCDRLGIVYFCKIILESSQNDSETTLSILKITYFAFSTPWWLLPLLHCRQCKHLPYIMPFLIYAYWSMSLWWLLMSWHHMSTRPSATTMLIWPVIWFMLQNMAL